MKVRKLSPTGDYLFGYPSDEFYVNNAAAVAQIISTRLKLLQGEWLLDTSQGTPYSTQILGKHSQASADAALREVILDTPGVVSISNFNSSVDNITRKYGMSCTVQTQYGETLIIYPL